MEIYTTFRAVSVEHYLNYVKNDYHCKLFCLFVYLFAIGAVVLWFYLFNGVDY